MAITKKSIRPCRTTFWRGTAEAANPNSSGGQEPDGADEYQAHCPHEIEIEPASGEEFQTQPVMDQERNHPAGRHHRQRMHERDQNRCR